MGKKPANWHLVEKHQFKKGQSGNPKGRPKDSVRLWKRLERMLDETAPNGRKYGEMVIEAYMKKLLQGDMQALKELFERTEGRVKQTVEHEGTAAGIQILIQEAKTPEEPVEAEVIDAGRTEEQAQLREAADGPEKPGE